MSFLIMFCLSSNLIELLCLINSHDVFLQELIFLHFLPISGYFKKPYRACLMCVISALTGLQTPILRPTCEGPRVVAGSAPELVV